jgi:CRP/FNR family transcriptional regulator, cyclic AMP receptor protein
MGQARSVDNVVAGTFDLAETHARALRQPNLFVRLTPREQATVLERAKRRSLEAGEALFAQGTFHDGIFLIQSGLIRTFYTSPGGREITLAYWQPGNIVGTPQVFDGGIHVWSGVAVRDSEVLAFDGFELRSLIESIPALAIGVIEALSFKGKCLSMLVQMLGTRSVSERLTELLCMLGELYGVSHQDGITVGPPFTHEVLAQMVGASRQWVTITLNRLQREGVLRIRKRQVIILRENLLWQRNRRTLQNTEPPPVSSS